MNDLKAVHKTVIACFFLGTMAALQVLGKDTATFITVGLLVLGGVGFAIGQLQAVQKQTNGGQEKLIRVIEEQSKRSDERMAQYAQLFASLPPTQVHTTIEGEVKNENESVGV